MKKVKIQGLTPIVVFVVFFVFSLKNGFTQPEEPRLLAILHLSSPRPQSILSGRGDVNGDGFDDVLLARHDTAQVFFGGFPMDTVPDVVLLLPPISPPFFSCYFWTASIVGDLNNDRFDDIVVGDEGATIGASPKTGAAYVYFGDSAYNQTAIYPDLILKPPVPGWFGCYGYSASGGDLNGDGISDLVVADFGEPLGPDVEGRLYIYFGGENFDTIPELIIKGYMIDTLGYLHIGKSVEVIGDVNGDGFDDLLVSADENDIQRVDLYLGGNPMDTLPYAIFFKDSIGEFGNSFSGGDINGDGYCDVLIADYCADSLRGRVYIYLGKNVPDTMPDLILSRRIPGEKLGYRVHAGNFTLDKYDDIVVSILGENNLCDTAVLYYGSSNFDTLIDGYIPLGGKLLGADITGDGYEEILVHRGPIYVYTFHTEGIETCRLKRDSRIPLIIFPNPAVSTVILKYRVLQRSEIKLEIFDVLGRVVETLVSGVQETGEYEVRWGRINLSSGVYWVKLKQSERSSTEKLVLLH
ncbi:MAG: T9SS type A sorting domain-containing protein [bacterium]|nr:T9SS type A sorting domain-containing protein [bacterium]